MSDTDLNLTPDAGAEQPGPGAANNNDPEGRPETAAQRTTQPLDADPKPGEPRYVERRLAKYADKQRLIAEERDQALSQLEAMRQRYEPQNDNSQRQPPSEQQIRNDERARHAARQENDNFNAKCLDVANRATGAYGQEAFQAAHGGWQKAGLDLNEKGHVGLLRDIVAMPDAEHLYQHIGSDPDLAFRLMEMSEKEAYAELRDLSRAKPWAQQADQDGDDEPSSRPFVPAQMTQAPRPATRQPGPARQSSRTIYDKGLSMDEFIAMRNKKR